MLAEGTVAGWAAMAALAFAVVALAIAVTALARARDAMTRSNALQREIDALRAGGSQPVTSVPPPAAPAVDDRDTGATQGPAWSPAIAHEVPPASTHETPRTPTLPPGTPDIARAPAEPDSSLEERIGVMWFTRIGAVVLLVGAASALEYLADRPWLGPRMRVVLAALLGGAVLAVAERLRHRLARAYVHVLLGLGLALLDLAAYAACAYYAVLPAPAAFFALAVLAGAGAFFSVRHRSQSTLVLALATALASPALLASDQGLSIALLAYGLVVTSVALGVAWRQRFAGAAWLALVGSWLMPVALATGWSGHDASRVPPSIRLVICWLFCAQWFLLGSYARRDGWPRVRPRVVLVMAAATAPSAGWIAFAAARQDASMAVAITVVASVGLASTWLRAVGSYEGALVAVASGAATLAMTAPDGAMPVTGWLALVAVYALVPTADAWRRMRTAAAPWARLEIAGLFAAPIAAAAVVLGLATTRDAPLSGAAGALVAATFTLAAGASLASARRDRLRALATWLPVPAVLTALAASMALDATPATLACAGLALALALASARLRLDGLAWTTLAMSALAALRAAGTASPDPHAVVLCGTASALWVAAWRWRRDPGDPFRARAALVLLLVGHALALDALLRMAHAFIAPATDEPGRRAVVATVALGLYGGALLAGGFARGSTPHRWLGLALIAATLAKLALMDVWMLDGLHRMVALVCVGVLLLAAGFLYARVGPRARSVRTTASTGDRR